MLVARIQRKDDVAPPPPSPAVATRAVVLHLALGPKRTLLPGGSSMATAMQQQRTMIDRMRGAAVLDVDVYEEVEADRTATGQAAGVVAIVAIASGLGAARDGGGGIVAGILVALLGWLAWSAVTYLIGDKLLGGTATWGELLRTLGFAQSPGVLYVFAAVPVLGWLVRPVVAVWILVAGIIAIRQALDFSTGRAIATALIGWVAVAIPMLFIGMIVAFFARMFA
jgi:hypothetical protein